MLPHNEIQGEIRQTWQAPDLSRCCALRFGQSDNIIYCLVKNPENCGFSLRFGSSFLCLHPKRVEIAAQTARKTGTCRL